MTDVDMLMRRIAEIVAKNDFLNARVTELQKANNREVERTRDWKYKYQTIKTGLRELVDIEPGCFELPTDDIVRIINFEPERPRD